MTLRKIAIVTLLALSLGACQTTGQRQTGGALIGAGLGGLLGSQFGSGSGKLAATALGVVGGMLIGSEIGRSMDQTDRAYYRNASARAETAPVGETITWRNPESGNSGSVTPTREGTHIDSGAYCREYQQQIIVGGRTESGYGQACRQPDGSWKVI